MFREPPKGCSHVGLSAGTGLGMSSAVVSNQDEHVAVNGNQQDFEAQGEEHIENDDMDIDLDEIENGRYQEPHRMVLPQEFFDDQNNAAVAPMEQDVSVDSDEAESFELSVRGQNENVLEPPCSDDESEDEINNQVLGQPKTHSGSILHSSGETDSDDSHMCGKKSTFRVQKSKRRSSQRDKKREFKHSCVSTFDPTQPSTSKSGLCTCDSSDPEEVNVDAQDVSNVQEPPLRAKRSSSRADNSLTSPAIIVKKIKKECDYLSASHNLNEEVSDLKNESRYSEDNKNVTKAKDAVERLDCLINSSGHKGPKPHPFPKEKDLSVKTPPTKNSCPRKLEDEENGGLVQHIDLQNAESARNPAQKFKNKRRNRLNLSENPNKSLGKRRLKSSKQTLKKSVQESYNFVSEGTQATSADIRRSHKKQKVSPPKRRSQRRTNSQNSPTSNSISSREEHKKLKRKQDFNLQNKATSTSDPLMEDDAVQVLRLVSESLISLSVMSCGISDIIVDHCHNLTHLEVQACRILKRLQLLHGPNIQRLNIGQCPKLEMDTLVLQVLCNLSYVNILVTFEPCMKAYYPQVSEKIIFQRAAANQSVILVHDYSGEANENIQATFKENIIAWMTIIQKMRSSTLPTKLGSKKKKKKWEPKLKYPWGHQLRRIHGVISSHDMSVIERYKYQILTNDRLFAAAIEVMPWERGIPPPCETLEWEADNQFLASVTNQLFTSKFLKRLITFYIPVSSEAG